MFHPVTKPAFTLAVLLAGCVPAFGDELQYLPDNLRLYLVVDITAGARTKTLEEFKKLNKDLAPKGEDDTSAAWIAKVSRVTMGVGIPDTKPDKGPATDDIEIMTAIKKITLDDVKALKKNSFRKNQAFKESKHGNITIYRETYQNQFGKDDVIDGDAFFIAEEKYVVSSKNVETLRKIIDRNKPATLPANMKAEIKGSASAMVSLLVDFQNLPADKKVDVHRLFGNLPGYAAIKADVEKVQTLVVIANEVKGISRVSATLTCSDKANAATIKVASEKALEYIRAKTNEKTAIEKVLENMKDTPGADVIEKYHTGARAALKAMQISAADAKVTVRLETAPEAGVHAIIGWFFLMPNVVPQGPPEKAKEPEGESKK